MIFEKAKWIWVGNDPQPNEFAVFEESFEYNCQTAIFSLAAETDYVLEINGCRVSFGQFAGYPFEKYYDEIDLSPFCHVGKNTLRLGVRYEGVNSSTHIDDGAGVIYSLSLDGIPTVFSGTHTLGALDERFVQHVTRKITPQLGLAVDMQAAKTAKKHRCVEVAKTMCLKARPVQKTIPCPPVEAIPLPDHPHIYDLGREYAGYLQIGIKCKDPCTVLVAYGEHLADGEVRRIIGKRDFSLNFTVDGEGSYSFFNPYLRVAARYLQVYAPKDVKIVSLVLHPYLYPLTEKKFSLSGIDARIYDTCVRTLRLCMNTHYEDCPWREQALYVMDARNQMLCGYHAFEESEFQRANLVLMSKGGREDGLLELTYPATHTPAIPFFSLMYPIAVWEYVSYTRDRSILPEVMPTILGILQNLHGRMGENGLIGNLEAPYWNFYEWTAGSDGREKGPDTHLILNCAYVYSLLHFEKLCEPKDRPFDTTEEIRRVRKAIEENFFCPQTGLFSLSLKMQDSSSQLGNAMALLIGLGNFKTVQALMHDSQLIPATLSMASFVYDALLQADPSLSQYVLEDIRQKYGHMLDCGATSFWETIDGEKAFQNAGSLCHGWSALPIHYYHKFFANEK